MWSRAGELRGECLKQIRSRFCVKKRLTATQKMRRVVARTIGGDRVIPDTAASPTAFPADLHSWRLAQEGE